MICEKSNHTCVTVSSVRSKYPQHVLDRECCVCVRTLNSISKQLKSAFLQTDTLLKRLKGQKTLNFKNSHVKYPTIVNSS